MSENDIWICRPCNVINNCWRQRCRNCGAVRPSATAPKSEPTPENTAPLESTVSKNSAEVSRGE